MAVELISKEDPDEVWRQDNLETLEIVKTLVESGDLALRGMVIIGPRTDGDIFCWAGEEVTVDVAIVLAEFLRAINLPDFIAGDDEPEGAA